MFRVFVALFVLFTCAGCSYTTAVPVDPNDRSTWGFRVYDPKPILAVTKTGASIVYIPNYSKPYAVRLGAFLAKNHSNLKISNGILTEIDADLDSTAIIQLLQQIAKDLMKPGGGAATAELDGELIGVYDFVFDEEGNLVGLRKLPKDVVVPFVRSRATRH